MQSPVFYVTETIFRQMPEGVKPFNVAVFAYFPDDNASSNSQRLWSLVNLLIDSYRNVQISLFTTEPEQAIRYSNIKTFHDKKPLLFGRQIILHRWAGKAKEADAIWCFGIDSFIQTGKRTLLHLLSGETENMIRYEEALQEASVVAVTMESELRALKKLAGKKESIVLLPGVAFEPEIEFPADEVKGFHTGGNEFFLYYGEIKSITLIIQLLKAFSIFKHRQKSSWKLMLECPEFPDTLVTLLKTYKYRDDVVLVSYHSHIDRDSVVAAAHAVIYPDAPVAYGWNIMPALAHCIPIIATAENREWLQDAALYVNADDEKELAEALMQLYKDESLHSRLAQASKERAKAFDPEKVAATLYTALGGPQQ